MNAQELIQDLLLHLGMDLESELVTVDSTHFGVRQIQAMITDAGQEMAARAPWRKLLRVKSGLTSSMVEGRNVVPYPSDYHALQEAGSLVDESTVQPIELWKQAGTWEVMRTSAKADSSMYAFLDHDGVALTKAGTISMRYYSREWVRAGDATQDRVENDSDEFDLPLVCLRYGAMYRWRRSQGLDYADVKAQYEALLDSEFRSSRNLESSDVVEDTQG